jgi:WXXGXW repeat (2 copies)
VDRSLPFGKVGVVIVSSMKSLNRTPLGPWSFTMSPTPYERLFIAAMVAALTTLTGCVVAPLGGPYRSTQTPYEAGPPGPYVNVAPPPPQYEAIPVAPALGYVWIGGHWGWKLGRHVWIGGRWALPPHGHHWVPHRWEHGQGGWRHHPGHWRRR